MRFVGILRVERIVVQDAEGESVTLGLRDPARSQRKWAATKAIDTEPSRTTKVADGAAVIIGLQEPLAERRVAFSAGDGRLQRQPDRVQDVRVQ